MAFEVTKEEEKVKRFLVSKNLRNIVAEVVVELDKSGSMDGLYNSGVVQRGIQQILPVALNFDDNRNLDVLTFADGEGSLFEAESLTEHNFEGYVKREIMDKNPKWGATHYRHVLEAVLVAKGFGEYKSGIFGKKLKLKNESKSGFPLINYFVTDGENSKGDKKDTTDLLQMMQDEQVNAYVLFIGIGSEHFSYIREQGNRFGNVGFVKIDDLSKVAGTDALYDMLLPDELLGWLRTKRN